MGKELHFIDFAHELAAQISKNVLTACRGLDILRGISGDVSAPAAAVRQSV